jgi:tetratricopeptide (TPR) repeat protein
MSKLGTERPRPVHHWRAFKSTALGLCFAVTVATLSGCASNAPGKPTTSAATASDVSAEVREAGAQAVALMKKGDWTAAEKAWQAIVDANPNLPGAAVNLGIVYGHLNRPDDARKTLESAASRWPDFAPAPYQLGRLLAAQGQFEAADAAYVRAAAINPNDAAIYYDRAVLNELYLQRLPVALENYEKFQQLQPIPDEQVGRWITDLRRRTGAAPPAEKTAASGGPSS